MRLIGWRLLAAISAAAIPLAVAATRPRYGGTLRLEIRERVTSIDPADRPAGAAAQIAMLVFDRLVVLDDSARPRPALAVSWQADAAQKRWEFRLRPGVKFHDGYPLTAAAVTGALQRYLSGRAAVTVSGESVVIQSERAMPGLPAELATPAASVSARGSDGGVVGTGPFRLARLDAGRRAALAAFDAHWGGRPFVDAIEIEMGRATRDQFVDLQVGKADVIELAPNEMRTATERGTKTWASAPAEVLALVFGESQPAQSARLREALALSIDRGAIYNVLLQRQGAITGALLPQWLSGYAFLFPAGMDLARARQLMAEAPAGDRSLTLGYDPADPLERIIAERIAVNARDGAIALQVTNQPRTDVRLARVRFTSLDPARALTELASALGIEETRFAGDPARPEALYEAERTLVEGFRVLPLFDLPEAYGVGPRVRLWLTGGIGRTGALRLADVWLDGEKP